MGLARIEAIASHFPERVLDNAALAALYPDWPAEKSLDKTGIAERRIAAPDEQLRIGGGYDHNFLLRGGPGLKRAARAASPRSGIALDVLTTEPCVQLYTGNFIGPSLRGRDGAPLCRHAGFCLETQHAPDAPNQPGFASTVLRPGEAFASRTVYRFGRY